MLTLDEAIKHCHEAAERNRSNAEIYKIDGYDYLESGETVEDVINECLECASEHEQLAGWLTELKDFRKWRETMKTVYADSSVLVMVKEIENGKP